MKLNYLSVIFSFLFGLSIGFNYVLINNINSCDPYVEIDNNEHFETLDNFSKVRFLSNDQEIVTNTNILVNELYKHIKNVDTIHAKIIRDYYDIALNEQKLYGFPASIKLAQMILEGGFSEKTPNGSILVQKGNNPFGIKYFGNEVPVRVQNWNELAYTDQWISAFDDCNTDMCKFVKFRGLWHSFRYHSELMTGINDKPSHYLKWIDTGDWRNWLYAIDQGGYATDEDYVSNLESLILKYNLYLLDEYSFVYG